MNICVAVDNDMGMMFNHRRQSQDKILREYLINACGNEKLWMNEYTGSQFELPLAGNIRVDEEPLDKAEEQDYCFVENLSLTGYERKIRKIILFKWNRTYPADTWLDVRPGGEGWQLAAVEEFKGNSHEKITKEEWVRVEEE